MDFIRREILNVIQSHLIEKEITMIVGARQVGKTTLMNILRDYLIKKGEKQIFFSLDLESDKKYFTNQEIFLQKIKFEFGENKCYIFIDEIQRKENAGIFLKGIYDIGLPYKFIVSGSGSIELKEKIHESLAGRKLLFELNPVSFPEFINFKTNYRYENKLESYFHVESDKLSGLLEEYLCFGGYPKIILSEEISKKYSYINEIYSSYIDRDILALLNIQRSGSYADLLSLLSAQIGSLSNLSEISKNLGISLPTLKNYLWYAEKTFILKKITPFFRNAKKEIIKSSIYYFTDLGLRNYLIGLFENIKNIKEHGFLFQNLVLNVLLDKVKNTPVKIHFWRTTDKAEVDFIISKGLEVIPMEVKFTGLKGPEIKRSMRSFIDKYKPKNAYIINLSLKENISIDSTDVNIIPYYQLFDLQF